MAGHSRLLDLCFCESDRIVAACSGSLPFLPPDVHAIMPYHTTGLPTTATIALDQHTFHLVSTPPQACVIKGIHHNPLRMARSDSTCDTRERMWAREATCASTSPWGSRCVPLFLDTV